MSLPHCCCWLLVALLLSATKTPTVVSPVSRSLSVRAMQAPPQPETRRRFRWSRQAQQDKAGFYYQPAGLCEDYPEEARTDAKLRSDFETMRRVGAKLLRCGISWDSIERVPGQYNWSFWDRLVGMADQYHVTLIPYVCYTPRLYAQERQNFWRQPPTDPHTFGSFMRLIATRYKGKIHSWELWNEPDNRDFWLGSAAQYADLVREGAQGVRTADPTAVVVLGGLANGPGPFFQTLKTQYHIEDFVDVVNLHGYLETWNNARLETYSTLIRAMAAATALPQDSPDLWLAEFGYSDFRLLNSQGDVEVFYDYEHTAAYQAAALFKAHVLALATSKLSLTAWYRIHDLTPSTRVIGDENNKYLGLLDVQGHPKPAFYAFRLYTRLFDQPTRLIDSAAQILQTPGEAQSVVHLFEKRNGDVIVVGWLRSSVYGEVTDTSGQSRDTRREVVSLRLPGRKFSRLTTYDLHGSSTTRLLRSADTLRPIVLTGAQVFIAELSRRR